MSRRTVFTAIFSAILTAAAANTGLAQVEPVLKQVVADKQSSHREVAPMPHERPASCAHCLGLDWTSTPEPIVVNGIRLTRLTDPFIPPPPNCAFDCSDGVVAVQYTGQCPQTFTYSGKLLFEPLPPLPRNPAERFGEYVEETRDGVRVVGFRVFGMQRVTGQFAYPMLGKSMIVNDDTVPGWWVESMRLPQPRTDSTPNMLFLWNAETPAPQYEEAHSCCTGASTTPVATCCTKTDKLTGMWVRELGDIQVVATIQSDELKVRLSQTNSDGSLTILTLTADYTLTREGLVHGAITGADVESKSDPHSQSNSGTSLLSTIAPTGMVDYPFSFRTKVTSAGLMVSNIKFGLPWTMGEIPNTDLIVRAFSGMYAHVKDGKVPSLPKCQKATVGPCEGVSGCLKSPSYSTGDFPSARGYYYGFVPVDNAAPVQQTPETSQPEQRVIQPMAPPTLPNLPKPMVPPEPPGPVYGPMNDHGVIGEVQFAPKPPANVPASAFDTISDALGQMMQERSTPQTVTPAHVSPIQSTWTLPACPPPVGYGTSNITNSSRGAICPTPPGEALSNMALPSSDLQVVGDISSSKCTLSSASTGITGAWVREVGPMLYVIKFETDQFTITASLALQLPDATVTSESLIITGDYHLMRDGKTLVGLITSVDMRLDSDLSQEGQFEQILQQLSQLQKDVTDQPFAFSARLLGNALTIGNVRFPDSGETNVWGPGIAIGGRYSQACEKSLPKPRPMKSGTAVQNIPVPPPPGVCYPAVGIVPQLAAPVSPQMIPNMALPTTIAPAGYPYCPQSYQGYPTGIPLQMPETKPMGPAEPPMSEKKSKKKQVSLRGETPVLATPPTRIDVIR